MYFFQLVCSLKRRHLQDYTVSEPTWLQPEQRSSSLSYKLLSCNSLWTENAEISTGSDVVETVWLYDN
jgi:hypothetical protein